MQNCLTTSGDVENKENTSVYVQNVYPISLLFYSLNQLKIDKCLVIYRKI